MAKNKKSKNLSKRVSALEKKTKPEKKWQENIDISNTTTFCESNSLTPFDTSILNLPEGVGQHARIGHQVTLTSYYARLLLQAPSGANGRIFRFVLYVPRNVGDRLSTGVGGNPLTVGDQVDADRFSVFFDKSIHIAPAEGGVGNIKQIVFKRKFKRGIMQQYNDGSAGTHREGDLRLYVVSSQQTGSSNKSYLQGYWKTYYTDV